MILRRSSAVLLLLPLACGDKEGSEGEDSAAPASFSDIRDEILVPSCGFSSCHGAGAGGLTIEADMTRNEWVGAESNAREGAILVVEGDPDSSYLLAKLEGDASIEGEAMPPGGSLDARTLDRIRGWIEAGAPE